ncbi:hypothetical protein K7H91_05635 [Martelella mediterranea]|nr:hypothetical protein [Martelella mediterranea]
MLSRNRRVITIGFGGVSEIVVILTCFPLDAKVITSHPIGNCELHRNMNVPICCAAAEAIASGLGMSSPILSAFRLHALALKKSPVRFHSDALMRHSAGGNPKRRA